MSRKGPLVIYGNESAVARAFRNLPGVEVASVDRLNLLQVRRGGSSTLRNKNAHGGSFVWHGRWPAQLPQPVPVHQADQPMNTSMVCCGALGMPSIVLPAF